MLSLLLKEVTSYLDRRAILSALFPSLLAWSVTAVVVLTLGFGWRQALEVWGTLGTVRQAFLVVAFVTLVALWTFLTLIFQPALVRLYQGYWPLHGLLAVLAERRRCHWQMRWDEFEHEDKALESAYNLLQMEYRAYQDLDRSLEPLHPGRDRPGDPAESRPWEREELTSFLGEQEQKLKQFKGSVPSPTRTGQSRSQRETNVIGELSEMGRQARVWCEQLRPYLMAAEEYGENCNLRRLMYLIQGARTLVEQWLREVEYRRMGHYHDFSLHFPLERAEVMPTRLGNVLKAAERYSWSRYRLDSVLIWSRLQPALPQEFMAALQDVRTSLELMLTLSGSTLLFGLTLSVAVSSLSPMLLPWWSSIPVLGLLLLQCSRKDWRVIVSLLSLLGLSLIVRLIVEQSSAGSPGTSALAALAARLQCLLLLSIVVVFAAWLAYQSAIQVSLAYGERIKTAIDLYRWKVLESLHVPLPADLKEERKTWETLCGFLYRGLEPQGDTYRYVQEEGAKRPIPLQPRESVPVATSLQPACRPIIAAELQEQEYSTAELPADVVRARQELIGLVPLSALTAGQPIRRSSLARIDPKLLEGTAAVSIPAAPEMVLGGNLRTGDLVDIFLVQESSSTQASPSGGVFKDILVLGIEAVPDKVRPYLLTIAVPIEQQVDIIHAIATARVWVSRRLSGHSLLIPHLEKASGT